MYLFSCLPPIKAQAPCSFVYHDYIIILCIKTVHVVVLLYAKVHVWYLEQIVILLIHLVSFGYIPIQQRLNQLSR